MPNCNRCRCNMTRTPLPPASHKYDYNGLTHLLAITTNEANELTGRLKMTDVKMADLS